VHIRGVFTALPLKEFELLHVLLERVLAHPGDKDYDTTPSATLADRRNRFSAMCLACDAWRAARAARLAAEKEAADAAK